jgi:hypothetical protein
VLFTPDPQFKAGGLLIEEAAFEEPAGSFVSLIVDG